MRILIADDHALYRAGLSMMLRREQSVTSISEACSLDEAVAKLKDAHFDAGIFDLDMPGMDGPSSLGQLIKTFPRCKIIVLSALSDQQTVSACAAAGCGCHIDKASPLGSTLTRIRDELQLSSLASNDGHVNPTARQLEVLELVASGMTNKEIARRIGIAPGTVKVHLASLLSLFRVRNRTQLLACYRRLPSTDPSAAQL